MSEVPATKLAALQKVLQSEFLNAVREVYEHVYETVDVQGNPEIRASATAKVRVPRASPMMSSRIHFLIHFFRPPLLPLPLAKVTPTRGWWNCPRRRRASASTSWGARSKTRQSTSPESYQVGSKLNQYDLWKVTKIIFVGGVADRHGSLKRGDQLLSVNGVSVEGEHHEKAVELLKAAKGSVKLVVR